LINPASSKFSRVAPGSKVARLYRRICILRATGQEDEADRLESGDLATAVAALQTASPSDASHENLATLFTAEEDRVANAAALAELIAPLLQNQLQPGSATSTTPRSSARTAKPSGVRSPSASTGPHDIATFIDEMIALERGP
jgi:hypothetical protein